MATHRRHGSPTGPRVYLDPAPRASTGTILTKTYDPRYDTRDTKAPRASISNLPSSSSTSSGRNNSIYESQPVKKVYDVVANSGSSRGADYVVRPRRDSNLEKRLPLNVLTKNVSPTREYFESPRDIGTYRDQARLLPPGQSRGSAHHQRHNSATRAETGRFFPQPGLTRQDREYHKRGPYVEKVTSSRPVQNVSRYEEPTYEYTNPHEQFERDFPPPATTGSRTRRESLTRRERPNSALGSKFEKLPFRRESATPRQFHQVERYDRRSGFESDPDRSRHTSHRTHPSRHAPVVHQREDGYSSSRDEIDNRRALVPVSRDDDLVVAGSKSRYREASFKAERERESERERPRKDYDRDGEHRDRHERRMSKTRDRDYERERERERPREYERVDEKESRSRRRREPKDRDDSPERSSGLKSLSTAASAAFGGLAAVGVLGSGQRKDTESDSETKREHRRRRSRKSRDESQEPHREQENAEPERKHRSERKIRRQDSSGSDTPDETHTRERSRSRTRPRSSNTEGYASEPDKRPPPMDVTQPQPESTQNRDPIFERALQESPVNSEGRTLSPGEGTDTRPRKVSIVEPGRDGKTEQRPRGILKPPRAVPFPEDPNPQREGVAPLKQAGKDGVPSGARWTKISRILVNPEALERAHERFEERDDYVIVLRVISREEIEKLAEKTREIRETREREWQKEVEERKQRRSERGDRDTEDEDDYDDHEHHQPLAIEPPSSAPPTDLRNLVQQSQAQSQAQPQMAHVQQTGYGAQQVPYDWQQSQAPQPQQQQHQQQYMPPHQPQPQPQPQAPLWQGQPQWAGQSQYQPQWNSSGPASARSSAERIVHTVPGQSVSAADHDAASYSQNV